MKFRHLVCALALFPLTSLATEKPTPPADTVVPLVRIGDFNLTNLHFSVFAAQQGEKINTQVQQVRLLNELVNTFMVAQSPEGQKLANNPELKAAMQVANARLLARAVIHDAMDSAKISDEEINKVYQDKYANQKKYEYKARHILLKSEDDAKAVIAELDKGGDFKELAKEKSTGPSKTTGGDLGWFTSDTMVKPFAAAVVGMQDGKYSAAPVKTQFGWHVILREGSRELPTPTLAEVKDEITQQLKTEKLSEFIKGLRDKADIEVIDADAEVVK